MQQGALAAAGGAKQGEAVAGSKLAAQRVQYLPAALVTARIAEAQLRDGNVHFGSLRRAGQRQALVVVIRALLSGDCLGRLAI